MRIKKFSSAFVISGVAHITVVFIAGLYLVEPSYKELHGDCFGLGCVLGQEVVLFRVQEPPKPSVRKPTFNSVRTEALNPPNGAAYGDVYFKDAGTNPFIDTEDDKFSTFGIDVDTASYTVMRRYLKEGILPPSEAIRVEEFVNAFDYNYTSPADEAFAVHLEGAPSKFGEGKRLQLLRIGIQGRVIPDLDVRSPLSLGSPYRLYTDNWFQGRLFMDSARKGVGCGYMIGDPYALAYMFADTIGLQKDGTEKITIEWLLTAPSKVFASVFSYR